MDYSKGRSEEELEPFYPNEILRHTLLTFLFISTVLLGVMFLPESFQKSTDEFASIPPRPPWYLSPFYQVSDLIKNKTVFMILITIIAIAFIGIPFLDRKSERRLWKKPIFFTIIIINLATVLVLSLIRFFK